MEALSVRSLEPLGFTVPAGWYGFVRAAGIGIVRQAGIPDSARGMDALEVLSRTDPESRTAAWEGRRMVRVDGGFVILNFMKYRERDMTASERSRRWRDAQRSQRRSATPEQPFVTQVEVEVEGEVQKRAPLAPLAEPSRSKKAARPEDVTEQTWHDWTAMRKARRSPLTETAMRGIRREAAKAGISLDEALQYACVAGWQTFRADWHRANGKPQRPGLQSPSSTVTDGRRIYSEHPPAMPVPYETPMARCECALCAKARRADPGR